MDTFNQIENEINKIMGNNSENDKKSNAEKAVASSATTLHIDQ